MLSILIPEYNYNCYKLVCKLAGQCEKANVVFEIIVLDDKSTLCKEENILIECITGCRLVESDYRLGAAKARNRLVSMAQYQHLLMLDCDAEIRDDLYIQRYLDIMKQHPVIVGGVCYTSRIPSAGFRLRWIYGRKRECRSAEMRNRKPYKSFLSFNLMIDRDIMLSHPYDEYFTDYGHEDSVMGLALSQAGISVFHTENPLIHNGLDPDPDYLAKSRKAVEKYVTNPAFQSEERIAQIKLFRVFRRIQKYGLDRLLAFGFRHFRGIMERNLCSLSPSLTIFDLYRLSYLCHYYLQVSKPATLK
jgi:Predicted glycosyltransferases